MTGPKTRQELYDRIRSSSKDEVILEEMVRLGFWPARTGSPSDPAEEIRRTGEIQRELTALRTEQSRLHNIEAIKHEMHRRRLEESRRKQKETKERHERERLGRAAAWKLRKEKEILWLGPGVSGGLSKTECDEARLSAQGLPVLRTSEEIASAMGLTVGQLRFLAFARTTSLTSHYVRFEIPKKTGGTRAISAPMPRLKRAQRWLLDHVLAKVAVHGSAHGFRDERNVVSNAMPHVGAGVVVNLDLRDFFPTVTYRRVRGMFRALGYGEHAASVFALIATEPEVVDVELDGKRWHVATSARRLPQGSPASPAVTNLLCRRLDKRLHGVAAKLGFVYTRYADDLTFSGPKEAPVGKLLRQVRFVVGQEGFTAHEEKTRVLRRGRQQEVTGVVVNERPSIDRKELRRFRALLFQIGKDGPEGKRWGSSPDVFAAAMGFAAWVHMVDRTKGDALLGEVRALAKKHGWTPPKHDPPKGGGDGGGAPEAAKAEEPKKKKWWQIF